MTTNRMETITTADGDFAAYVAVPDSGSGPGVLVLQEIFGINDNMRGTADRLAAEGYVALVPDMFWRIQPGFERKDESGFGDALEMVQQYDWSHATGDLSAALGHLRGLPECTGKVGVVGFCFGGTLTYLTAATARADGRGPDAAVSYYGSGVHDMLEHVSGIECPILFQYGAEDPFIPSEQIDLVEQAVSDLPTATVLRYPSGHAFSNWDAPSMYNQECADQAWRRTLTFFETYLAS